VVDLPASAGPPVAPDASAASEAAAQPTAAAPTAAPEEAAPAAETAPAEDAAAAATEPQAEAAEAAPPAIDVAATTDDASPADPVGFALAWMVMAGMIIALIFVARRFMAARPYLLHRLENPPPLSVWILPLVLIGLGVAAYLAYVELTQSQAVCGPVGECHLVQASPYARIGGVPIAVLGLLNYLAVGGLWLWQRRRPAAEAALYGLLGLTVFGVFFSIYLTALEIFVIGAVCAWCLTSAVVTTALMVVVVYEVTKRPSEGETRLEFAGG
jgi:uncharacterized membrane protein